MKGFLPIDKPLRSYSLVHENSLALLQELATNLPKLLLTDRRNESGTIMGNNIG